MGNKTENTSTWFMIFQLKNLDQEPKIEKKVLIKTIFGNKMLLSNQTKEKKYF